MLLSLLLIWELWKPGPIAYLVSICNAALIKMPMYVCRPASLAVLAGHIVVLWKNCPLLCPALQSLYIVI